MKGPKIGSKSISKSQLGLGPGYKSKSSPETSLTSRQESKMGLQTSKLTKLDQNQSQNPSLDLGLATNLNNHQKQVKHRGKSPKRD